MCTAISSRPLKLGLFLRQHDGYCHAYRNTITGVQAPAIHCQCPRERFDTRVWNCWFQQPPRTSLPWPVLATSARRGCSLVDQCPVSIVEVSKFTDLIRYLVLLTMSSPLNTFSAWLMRTWLMKWRFPQRPLFSYQLHRRQRWPALLFSDNSSQMGSSIKKSANKKKNKETAEIEKSLAVWIFYHRHFLLGQFSRNGLVLLGFEGSVFNAHDRILSFLDGPHAADSEPR